MSTRNRFARFALMLTLLAALCAGLFSPRAEVVEAKPKQLPATNVVISEFRFRGDGLGNDEFVELYNPTNSAINISGWLIRGSNNAGTISTRATIPASTTLQPGQYYLIAHINYTGPTAANLTYGTGITDDGGVALTLSDGVTIIDQVGLSVGSTYKEGTPQALLAANIDQGYERKLGGASDSCQDDGNNINDFHLINPSNPQNSSTPTRICGGNADLRLTHSVSNLFPSVGDSITFTITVFNDGTDTARNVQIRSLLPSGLFFVSSSTLTGSYNNGTGIWDVGTLANSSSAVLTITATILTVGAKTNTAEVWYSYELDPDPADNTASVIVGAKVPGLNITNTVNNPNPLVGTNVIFTVKVDNPTGNPYNATNVNVAALLPPGLTYVSHAVTQGTYVSVTGAWSVGTIPINSSATLTITALVTTSTPATFTTTVTSNEYLDNSASSSLNNPLSGQAELTINQTLDLNTGTAGQVNLVISLQNTTGPDTATGVSVRDLLPSGLTYVSHTTASGTYDSNTGIWSIGNLNNGSTADLRIKVKVASSGSSTNNTAQVWTTNQFDSNPADNSKSLEVPIADLSLIQTVDITPSTAIFTITLTNSGPDDATVQVKSNLPDVTGTYTFVSSSQPAAFNPLTGIWNVGLLPDGSSATLVITTTTTGVLQSHIVEIYSSDMVDPDSIPNNKARLEDDISGLPYADLHLTQTVNNSNPNTGATVTFTVKVSNSGTTSVASLKIKDQLPAGLTYVSSSTASGSYNSGAGIWTVGALASGASAELSITATVATGGSFVNLAEVYESSLYDIDSIPANGANAEDDNSSVTVATNTVVRSVIINEVAWAGTTSSLTGDEWIELYNTTNAAINITGWTLKAADGTPSITLNGTISAGGYFLLERDDDTTVSDILADQIYTGDLSNSGEALTLYDSSNKVIDTANGNGGSWPAGSSSTYGTMERTSTSTDSDSIWITNTGTKRNGKNANSGDILGTPKQSNTVSSSSSTATPEPTDTPTLPPPPVVVPPRPIINEILARPGFDWNQDGKADVFDEFIEIKNLTVVDISLSGWKLDTINGKKIFSLPEVTLKPGERIVYYSKETNLLLSDGGETVRLSNSSGKIYDAFTYTVSRVEDKSFCRLPDGNPGESWFEDCLPTPNLTNTREGQTPTSPDDNTSPVCNLPDTIPLDFFIPECNGYGAHIWNPFYWDLANWTDKLWIQQTNEKWRTFIE